MVMFLIVAKMKWHASSHRATWEVAWSQKVALGPHRKLVGSMGEEAERKEEIVLESSSWFLQEDMSQSEQAQSWLFK